ncbi:hypothetical protein EKI60_02300 [Candidatus Saccharibacteria bacterium]|nr:MAG: hypothetical protein EKI60_02300 [Candidatus Saccharibacteria bacterium]
MSITHYQEAETKTIVNKEIEVKALSFSGKGKFRTFPKQIAIDTEEITFVETGMRYLLQKGHSMVQLFDMSDGTKRYRLQFDASNFTWTLLNVTSQPR